MDLWDDPYETTRKEFKHGPWIGMASRQVWNSSPNHRNDKICIECGYKWGYTDFRYRPHPSREVEDNAICWNCWMIDTDPEYIRRIWARIDNGGKAEEKKSPKMEHL